MTTKKYIINICYGDRDERRNSLRPSDSDFVMAKYREWTQKIAAKTLVCHKLSDGEGRIVKNVKGSLIDGPYVESKESVGGFYIVEATNYDEAVAMAKDCPSLLYQGGYVEVRVVDI